MTGRPVRSSPLGVTHRRQSVFRPALVNRTWSQLFGHGFVNPVDDFRDDLPPTQPDTTETPGRRVPLRARLQTPDPLHLQQQGVSAYGRPLPDNENDRELWSHMAVKVLSPEAFYDSLTTLRRSRIQPRQGDDSEGRSPRRLLRFFRTEGETDDETRFGKGFRNF